MSEADTQTVVTDTNATPQVDAAVTGAQNDGGDLDTLLKAYDEKVTAPAATTQTQPERTAGTEPDLKAATDEVLSARDEIRAERFNRDMDQTVKDIRGDMPADYFDDTFMKAFIDASAAKDPRLGQAWLKRNENPQQFKRVVTALSKEFSTKYGKLPDKAATEDRELVSAAVRGASTRTPEAKAPEYGKLSNADFQKEKEKLFGT